METVAVVLSVGKEHQATFEQGFREHELPVWRDLEQRGLIERATLNRLDISTHEVKDSVQYLVAVIFRTAEGHHAHDDHPSFLAWNKIADKYQIASPLAFGGETIVELAASR